MAPTQPSGAAHQGLNLSPTLSRSSGILKPHRSPSMPGNGSETQLTELHARTRPVLPHTQNHATVRAQQLSVGAAPPTQITHNQGPPSSGQQASMSTSIQSIYPKCFTVPTRIVDYARTSTGSLTLLVLCHMSPGTRCTIAPRLLQSTDFVVPCAVKNASQLHMRARSFS